MESFGKRFLRLLVLTVVLVSVLAMVGFAAETDSEPEWGCHEHGDVNGDGSVEVRDAIYVLYNSIFGDEAYPVNQGADFNDDGKVDRADAIWLLYASFGQDDNYKLQGEVHNYYASAWTWIEAEDGSFSATLTLTCDCGLQEPVDGVVTVDEKNSVSATCTTAGTTVYTATYGEFTSTKTVTVAATGHSLSGNACKGSKCANCDYEQTGAGHKYDGVVTTAATCTAEGQKVYTCTVCKDEYTTSVAALGHTYKNIDDVVNDCAHTKQFQCETCKEKVSGETYYVHTYTATLTKEATCSAVGEKTYTCTCGDFYTEQVEKNDSHDWNEGVIDEADITTYTCEDCDATKTTVAVTKNTAVSTGNLNNELQLENNTSVSLDQDTIDGLGDTSIKISVDEVEKKDLNLSDEQKEQIGENTVYNFNMTDANGDPITKFGGEVTISLPYTLSEGEDIDSIDVWYIDDEGNATQVTGTYANGYVTFTTTHFSYYTVTRLTTAERCARYGHILVSKQLAATCTQDGYEKETCQRCGAVLKNVVLAATGHDYSSEITAATCTAAGEKVYTCGICDHSYTEALAATGHDYSSETTAATCTDAGEKVYTCGICEHSYTEELPVVDHVWEDHENVAPTCTANGYKTRKCKHCKDVQTVSETGATGHNYQIPENGWAWAEDGCSASVTLHCTNGCDHTKTQNAVITELEEEKTTCLSDGSIIYEAVVSVGNTKYWDRCTISSRAPGHKPEGEWVTDGAQHYRECAVCGEIAEVAGHSWSEATVSKEPTCTVSGESSYTCTVCGYEKKTVVSATGKHNYIAGFCTTCGQIENDCTHEMIYFYYVDLTAYGVCGEDSFVEYASCECGLYKWTTDANVSCDFTYEQLEGVDDSGNSYFTSRSECRNCGLFAEEYYSVVATTDPCGITYVNRGVIGVKEETILNLYVQDSTTNPHPKYYHKESVDLSEYGLCMEKLSLYVCPCGEQVSVTAYDECDWEYTGYDEEADCNFYACLWCGAVKSQSWSYKYLSGCINEETEICSYYVDGKLVYTYSSTNHWDSHTYRVESYELSGTSCEDGIFVSYVCIGCENRTTHYSYDHIVVNEEFTEVPGTCFYVLVQESCPCEVGYSYFYEGGDCAWEYKGDNEAGAEVYYCEFCGTTKLVSDKVELGEDCYGIYTYTAVYLNSNGEQIATASRRYDNYFHNYERTYKLLGTSCEDGWEVTNTCTSCGEGTTYTYDWHGSLLLETYDLSEYDTCYTTVSIYGCLCGQYKWSSFDGDDWCEFEDYETDGIWYSVCTKCGLTVYEYSEEASEDTAKCQVVYTHYIVLVKDGEELLTITYSRVYTEHTFIFELTLLEGATTCDDGYTVTEKCMYCDATYEYDSCYGCSTWRTGMELISDDNLCGDLYIEQWNCACGQYFGINRYWENGNCEYDGYFYDEELEMYVSTCVFCGVHYYGYYQSVPNEMTCTATRTYRFVYFKDEKVLIDYSCAVIYESHAYQYSFDMQGESCEDGYYLSWKCQDCGKEERNEDLWYGHDTFLVKSDSFTSDCGTDIVKYYSCPCGLESWCGLNSADHSWDERYNEELGRWINTCTECGVVRVWYDEYTYTGCEYYNVWGYIYYLNGEEVFRTQDSSTGYSHNYVYSFEMLGASCEDGYYLSWECKGCGESGSSEELRTDHSRYYLGSVEYTTNCGSVTASSYSCACGYTRRVEVELGEHSWEERYDEDRDEWFYTCTVCGLLQTWYDEYTYNGCEYYNAWGYIYYLDNVELCRSVRTSSGYRHDFLYTLTPSGTSCEDGYTIDGVCRKCQETETWTDSSDHDVYLVKVEDVTEDWMCSTILLRTCSCACGLRTTQSLEWNCDFSEIYDEDLDRWVNVCAKCGLQYYYTYERTYNTETCQTVSTWHYVFMRDGQTLFTYDENSYGTNHRYVYTYEMFGTTCDEGYYAVGTCVTCGYSFGIEQYEHEIHPKERQIISTEDCCSILELVSYECACAENSYSAVSWLVNNCDMSGTWDEELDAWVYCCENCDLKYYETTTTTKVEGTCEVIYNTEIIYMMGDEFLSSTSSIGYGYNHTRVFTLTLAEGAASCDEGYYASWTCRVCGETGQYPGMYTGHGSWELDRTTVYDGTGICGPIELVKRGCACGENLYYGYYNDTCNWENTGYDSATSSDLYICTECGAEIVASSRSTGRVSGSCDVTYTRSLSYTLNDVVLLDHSVSYAGKEHTYVSNFALNGTTCEEGYTEYRVCLYCKMVGSTYTYDSTNHNTRLVNVVEVSLLGGCDTTIWIYSCACGSNSYTDYDLGCNWSHSSWSETGTDGVNHYYWTDSCADCGLYHTGEEYTIYNKDTCTAEYHEYETFTIGETKIVTHRNFTYESHTSGNYSYVLKDGSSSCEDGVWVTRSCEVCGYSDTWNSYDHGQNKISSIDLEAYGSICGGSLDYYACPCGQKAGYRFSNELKCDLDCKNTDDWIEGDVDDSQNVMGTGHGCYTYCYIYTCAVTDPEACGLTIRMADYWVRDPETCQATRYELWQLGYDAETGTCQQEILIATGETKTFHDIEKSSYNVTAEDGSWTYTWLRECKDCSSYQTETDYYDTNGRNVKYEGQFINTLDDGMNKEWSYIREYIYLEVGNSSYSYQKMTYDYWVYADGDVYWVKHDYSYDFTDSCVYTCVTTNNRGETWSYTDSAHYYIWTYSWVKENTCSQYGIRKEQAICPVCNVIVYDQEYSVEPYAHCWHWDSTNEFYYCCDCGLENVNGASGSIVLEDLTDTYGNGTNYVVGYWNRGAVEINLYVSLILDEPLEDGNDELVLTGITFNYLYASTSKEGITAITFSMDEVNAAAAAAVEEAGYTGDYDVRISFVPVNSEDELDYAVTFGTLADEESDDSVAE